MWHFIASRPEIRYHETYSFEGRICSKRRSALYRQALQRVGRTQSGVLLEITTGDPEKDVVLANVDLFDAKEAGYLPRLFSMISVKTGFGTHGEKRNLPWEAASFDAIICVDAFSKFQHPLECLRELRRVLQPGGRLVLADQWFRQRNPLTDNLLSSYNNSGLSRIYSCSMISHLLRNAGFSKVTCEPAGSNNYICTALVI